MPSRAFWKDQKLPRMGGSIEPRFLSLSNQRLSDQKALDVVVTPHDPKVLSVHGVTGCCFVLKDLRVLSTFYCGFKVIASRCLLEDI